MDEYSNVSHWLDFTWWESPNLYASNEQVWHIWNLKRSKVSSHPRVLWPSTVQVCDLVCDYFPRSARSPVYVEVAGMKDYRCPVRISRSPILCMIYKGNFTDGFVEVLVEFRTQVPAYLDKSNPNYRQRTLPCRHLSSPTCNWTESEPNLLRKVQNYKISPHSRHGLCFSILTNNNQLRENSSLTGESEEFLSQLSQFPVKLCSLTTSCQRNFKTTCS